MNVKLMKGLQECIRGHECQKCPYFLTNDCRATLLADAEEASKILKSLEPRVLGLEELPLGKPDEAKLVYIEVPEDEEGYGEYRGYAMPEMNDGILIWFVVFGKSERLLCETDSYNLTWRCWNTRPTEEEREAVKWNE